MNLCKKLKKYPTQIIPTTQIPIKIPNNFGFTALLSITRDGKLKVVTAIIKLKTTPNKAPFPKSASLIGMHPKISAYIGTPQRVAIITPKGLFLPKAVITHCSGIQLCITAPIKTPTTI